MSHPTKGHARVIFERGPTSAGGSFAYAPMRLPSSTSTKPFRNTPQDIEVGKAGFFWR